MRVQAQPTERRTGDLPKEMQSVIAIYTFFPILLNFHKLKKNIILQLSFELKKRKLTG